MRVEESISSFSMIIDNGRMREVVRYRDPYEAFAELTDNGTVHSNHFHESQQHTNQNTKSKTSSKQKNKPIPPKILPAIDLIVSRKGNTLFVDNAEGCGNQ